MNKAESPQPVLNGNVTHGDTLLKKAMSKPGSRALDGRSTLAKELGKERRELIQALSVPTEVSPQEMAIVEMIAQKRIRRKPLQEWALLNRDRLFDRKKRSIGAMRLSVRRIWRKDSRSSRF